MYIISTMKNLNENIQRIKQMMNTINESSFDKPMVPEITPEVRQGITDVLNGFIQNPEFDDYDLNVNGGNFYIGDEEGVFYLEYEFSIYYSSRSSFTPGRMYMDNGDPGYPDEGEPAEYEIEITNLKYVKFNDGTDEILYNGKDITNFMNVRLSNEMTGEEFLHNKFDERIQELEAEDEGDEPDYEPDFD